MLRELIGSARKVPDKIEEQISRYVYNLGLGAA